MLGKLRRTSITAANGGYVVSDPYGVSEQSLWLSKPALAIATMLSDHEDLEAFQADVERRAGVKIPLEQLQSIVTALDEAGFLDTPATRERLDAAEREFLAGGVRPMFLADRSFPGEVERFKGFAREFRALAPARTRTGPLKGLVLPHLELTSVPEVYGAALEALKETPAPERVLLVGVAHKPIEELAAGLALDIETPLGRLPVDREAFAALAAALPFPLANSPLAFRQEHSIEFPAALLHEAWPQGFRVVPIVVSGTDDPAELARLEQAIKGLNEQFPCFPVASVDLSHVGARFGDPDLHEEVAASTEELDRAYLEAIAAGRFRRAFEGVTSTGNPTRIDAYASVQALHPLLVGEGEVLAYKLAIETQNASAVGAGAVAYR